LDEMNKKNSSLLTPLQVADSKKLSGWAYGFAWAEENVVLVEGV